MAKMDQHHSWVVPKIVKCAGTLNRHLRVSKIAHLNRFGYEREYEWMNGEIKDSNQFLF